MNDAAPPELTFLKFLQGMAAQAQMQLGIIPHPLTGERAVDAAYARATVRILELLEQKTQGNRTPDEDEYLRTMLTGLRERVTALTAPPR